MGDTGREEPSDSLGNTAFCRTVVPVVVPSGAELEPSSIELMSIWAQLNEQGRVDLLAVARGLATGTKAQNRS
jgi:hypothetical protein